MELVINVSTLMRDMFLFGGNLIETHGPLVVRATHVSKLCSKRFLHCPCAQHSCDIIQRAKFPGGVLRE